MKRWIAILLAFAMVFSLGICAYADPVILSAEDADTQIQLINSKMDTWKQKTQSTDWKYMVTDLDHNGQLEIIGALQGDNYKTSVVAWEVNQKCDDLTAIQFSSHDPSSFPEIIMENADTYYDASTDIWYYMFTDASGDDSTGYNASKCSLALKSGTMTDTLFATAEVEFVNGYTVITYLDANGQMITPDEFNSAGANVYAGLTQSSTNFDWFTITDAKTVSRLVDSYSIFLGDKQPTKDNPSDSTATPTPTATAAPVVTPVPAPVFLYVTKNPTNEYHSAGEQAWFVATADNCTSMVWTFVSPYGGEYSWQSFCSMFPYAAVSGTNSTSLCIGNFSADMSGWGAYCTFYGNNQTARSNTAYMYYVQPTPTPTPAPTAAPTSNYMNGSVLDFLMSSVTIQLDNGTSVQVLKDVCTVSAGDLAIGAPATVWYTGDYPTANNIYRVDIEGLVM